MDINQILGTVYYGNTVAEWTYSLLIILGAIVLGKALYWFCGNVIKKFTTKTKNKFDDIIIDMLEEPLVFALTLAGIWYGINNLVLSEAVLLWIWRVFKVLIIINVAWFVTRLVDAIYKEYLLPLADKSEKEPRS